MPELNMPKLLPGDRLLRPHVPVPHVALMLVRDVVVVQNIPGHLWDLHCACLSASEQQSAWVLGVVRVKNRWGCSGRGVSSLNEKTLLPNHTCKITCKKSVLAVLTRTGEAPAVSKLLGVLDYGSVSRFA